MRVKFFIAKVLSFVPDKLFSIIKYSLYHKKIPNLNGSSFSEKLLSKKCGLMGSEEKQLRETVTDRLLVRDFVEKTTSGVDLIPLLWSGKIFTKKIWDGLPERFVIKARHGSQMVKIVDKNKCQFNEVYNATEEWKKTDYYLLGREWVYKNTPRELVVEEFISFNSDVPPDYKFFCVNGKVELVQIDLERFKDHKRNLYSRDFEQLDVKLIYPSGEPTKKPRLFEQALDIAEKLSQEFDFIRVDLYILDEKIYFGELTNFPENGLGAFEPQSYDQALGAKMRSNNA
ncbi:MULTISPECIES: ATP-grasp fold amidoligase family protein [unclassified Pseudoalteromonas]|mgnify:CR=1 FL=1|jgi:hypothetical protein|uniref:ATP-grasp fold amidoligase family protein n=1 Tax=unclassified Pseudoalteromonas TaxID=194690 RepID=UPI00332816F2